MAAKPLTTRVYEALERIGRPATVGEVTQYGWAISHRHRVSQVRARLDYLVAHRFATVENRVEEFSRNNHAVVVRRYYAVAK